METKEYILITQLCSHYMVEIAFFNNLHEAGLIKIITIEKLQYLHKDKIYDLEKMIRIHVDLQVNIEGLDVVFNLLQKVEKLQTELKQTKSRLSLYEKF